MTTFDIRPYRGHRPTRPLTPEEEALVPANPPISQPKDRTPRNAQRPLKPKTKAAKQARRRKARSVPFTLPRLEQVTVTPKATPVKAENTVYELKVRVGTGSYQRLDAHPNPTVQLRTVQEWIRDYADDLLAQKFAVEWHDEQRWFKATHEFLVTIWAVIQGVE